MEDLGGSTNIKKLTDSSYHAWKQKFVLLLTLKDLDTYIEDSLPSESDETYIQWVLGDKKAQVIIGLSLSTEQLKHVRDVTSAKQMWNVIKDVFERHTFLNKLTARRRFYTVTMETGEKMLT